MKLSRIRPVRIAAALVAFAIAGPVATAGAATTARSDGAPVVAVPVAELAPTVTGPTFVTSAPATFINTNTQVSGGPSSAGDQVAP